MIKVTKEESNIIFDVIGMHKLWAFKSQLIIPADHILNVYQDMESIKGWSGWRAPGTSVPGLIKAGTFYKDENKIFWDVSNMDNCIIIDLKDEDYQQLIIEVENPSDTIEYLTNGQ